MFNPIILTDRFLALAEKGGIARFDASAHWKNRRGLEGKDKTKEIEACGGEVAVVKAVLDYDQQAAYPHLYQYLNTWTPPLNTPDQPEIANVDVKTTTYSNGRLPIHDHYNWNFVLAIADFPKYRIAGWTKGMDVKGKFQTNFGNTRETIDGVPQNALNTDPDSLLRVMEFHFWIAELEAA